MENPLVRIEPGLFIWSILTFLVLLTVLARFVWKPLTEALDKREKKIRQSLENAEKARQEAERISSEYDVMISKAREEALTIINEGKVASEKLTTKILQDARDKAEQIRRDAEKQINAEKESAIAEIKKEAVTLSLHVASKIIGRNITKEDNLSIIKASLEKLDRADA